MQINSAKYTVDTFNVGFTICTIYKLLQLVNRLQTAVVTHCRAKAVDRSSYSQMSFFKPQHVVRAQ